MRIVKFVKSKNGMYTLELDNSFKIKVHEDLILKYELLLKKELDNSLVEKIAEENKTYEIYEIALKYINLKLRSKKELKNYLIKKGYDDNVVDEALVILTNQGYLNDEYYANSYVHDRINLSTDGPIKITEYLKNQGISDEVIYNALEVYTNEIEEDRINKIVDKQVKLNKNKGINLLKKKIQLYLVNLGYEYDLVNKCINSKNMNEDKDIYKKEYDKIYKQLSKKYSGKELEYRIKQKLYQKGFSYSEFEVE